MRKSFKIAAIIVFFFVDFSLAQSFKFGWITDTHLGLPGADEDFLNVANDIKFKKDIEFVVVTGDITESGKNKDFDEAKEILGGLQVPYYIIPGNHDTKWGENGNKKFLELWNNDKFVFEKHNVKFIGLNSGITWESISGHIKPEDLIWLDSICTATPKQEEIYFFVHHPLDGAIDNWFKLTNILRKANIKIIFVGHEHINKINAFNGIPIAMSRTTLNKGKSWGYTLVDNRKDSVFFYEETKDTLVKLFGAISKLGKLDIPKVDSIQFENYGAKILWNYDLNKTISTEPVTANGKVYFVSGKGTIYCYDLAGKMVWQFESHSAILSRPAIQSGVLIAGTIEGDLIELDTETGRVITILGTDEPITTKIITIPFNYNMQDLSAVVFGTSTGKLMCYELSTLNPVWENKDIKNMIVGEPLFIKDRIVCQGENNTLYCIDAATGFLNWKWSANKNSYNSPSSSSMVTDGKNVYLTTSDKFVTAIDLLLGSTVWRKNDLNSYESIGISNDLQRLFIKTPLDKFYMVTANNGKQVKEINVEFGNDEIPNQPIEYRGKIILGSANGMIYLIDENFNCKPLLFTGTAGVYSVKHVKDNIFTAANIDGRIILFEVK
jgi:outer membrane protein assembly factor BamB/Icc-related predicted phosphoesterase